MEHITLNGRVALVTGAARRIGACIARTLHAAGMNLALHHRHSAPAAAALAAELTAQRPGSVTLLAADLQDTARLPGLIDATLAAFGRLDALVNNASSFYPTPIGSTTEAQWDELFASNLKAPFFLAQAAAPALRATRGAIVNLVDIHAGPPMPRHTVYCMAKAGMAMLTRSLALELAPEVRVNGVAPGAILWPEAGAGSAAQAAILARVPLGRLGSPDDIARTVLFLLRDAPYVTGQVLAVDGGRSLSM